MARLDRLRRLSLYISKRKKVRPGEPAALASIGLFCLGLLYITLAFFWGTKGAAIAAVGLSCVLLVGAGLFARTLQNLKNVNLGFNTENVVTFGVRPATVYDNGRKLQVYRSLIEGLATLPGVRAVGANRERLLTGGRSDSGIIGSERAVVSTTGQTLRRANSRTDLLGPA